MRAIGPAANRLPPRDVALVVAISTIWGVNFIPIRWALDEVPPFALSSLRFLLAAVPMVFFVPRPRLPVTRLVAYGLVIAVAQFGLLFLAIRLGMAAGLASLLMQMQMFFTMGLAALVTGDRIRRHQVVGALVSSMGIGLLAWNLLSNGARTTAVAFLLIVLSSFSWACGNVLAKATARKHSFDLFGLVVWSSLAAPLPLAAISFFLEGGWAPFQAVVHASPRMWASTAFMAYAATLFGYGQWNKLLQKHSAGLVTPFSMVIPVAGLGGAALVLHESLNAVQAVGALVVLVGIALAFLGEKRPWRPRGEVAPSPVAHDPLA